MIKIEIPHTRLERKFDLPTGDVVLVAVHNGPHRLLSSGQRLAKTP